MNAPSEGFQKASVWYLETFNDVRRPSGASIHALRVLRSPILPPQNTLFIIWRESSTPRKHAALAGPAWVIKT